MRASFFNQRTPAQGLTSIAALVDQAQHSTLPFPAPLQTLLLSLRHQGYCFCRELVLAAFDKRQGWQASVPAEGLDNDTNQVDESVSSSLLRWGEYERIDWELAYAGV